jgi:hypothetical protein
MTGELLVSALPAFAAELEGLLLASDEPELAAQVQQLRIVGRCRCHDSFCSSFYSEARPEGAYDAKRPCVCLEPLSGLIVLDVAEERIVYVEVLYREDVQKVLAALFPE